MIDLAPHLSGFLAAYAILLVGASSPGPSVAMILGIATGQGRGPALVASAGVASGSIVLNLGTLVGVGLILSQAAWAMSLLRVIGAAYLLYLAHGAFRRALNPPVLRPQEAAGRSALRHFARGFTLQVTNPKAIAFWLAIAAIGATEGGGPAVAALFVLGAFLISFLCHGAWAVALSAAPVRAAYAARRRWIEAALGTFFVFAAWKLATSEN